MASSEAFDVREGGRWSWPQRLKNDAIYVVVMGLLGVCERLPRRVLEPLGAGLGIVAWSLLPRLRRLAEANARRAGVPAVTVRRAYVELGRLLGGTVATFDPRRALEPLPFLPGARACLDEAIAEGHGVVFASAHLGPWERVAATLAGAGVPLAVVAREPYDPRLGRIYTRLREARGVRTVYRGASGAGIALLRVLKRGGVLGIPMDLATRAASISVPFLGHAAPTPVGPARLAIRTGAAVVVGTAARNPDGTLGIAFSRIAKVADEAELTARINAELSRRILALPEAWPWMHPRWP